MQSSLPSPKTVRFGTFKVDLVTGELRKRGRKVELQGQPFHVLALLLQRPGELVTREELRQALWPDDSFVDFDESLNKAVQKLRHAFGDSPHNPHFIETIPRKGYRFIASVEHEGEDENTDRTPLWLFAAAAALFAGFALTVLLIQDGPKTQPVVLPLTTYPGSESSPSFSPDGNELAFTWNGPKQDNRDIYVKLIGTENLLRLTNDQARDSNPAWSPDGRAIAFVRSLPGEIFGVYLMPAIGGEERKLAVTGRLGVPAWSPDSKWLVFSDKDAANAADETSSLRAVSIASGEIRRLTSAPRGAVDLTGAFSPDGRNFVFRRGRTRYFSELYLLKLDLDFSPKGEPKQITFQGGDTLSPTWTPDGREIVYTVISGSASEMWRVPVSGPRTPRRVEFAGDQVGELAISRRGNRLAYEQSLTDLNIWRLELHGAGDKAGRTMRLISSTRFDLAPQYSPDGNRIVFISSRSGHHEVWICKSDGSGATQLTSMRARVTGAPHWSPDGKQIVFDSNAEGQFEVYMLDAGGGRPRRLTSHPADDAVASFSRNGRWIYFASSRTGTFEIWKMPAAGGEPIQLTKNGGWWGLESPDAKYLFFAPNPDSSALLRLPLGSGDEQKIVEPMMGASIAIGASGIYFARPPLLDGRSSIESYSFSTGKTTSIATTPQPAPCCFAVSPDERYLLYTQFEQSSSDLMLVDNFH